MQITKTESITKTFNRRVAIDNGPVLSFTEENDGRLSILYKENQLGSVTVFLSLSQQEAQTLLRLIETIEAVDLLEQFASDGHILDRKDLPTPRKWNL